MTKCKKIGILFLSLILVVLFGGFAAFADQNAYVIFNHKNPNIGDTVNVTFRFYAVGDIQYTVTYDAESLQPITGTGANGTLPMHITGSGHYTDQMVTFRVLKKQRAYVGVTASKINGNPGPTAGAYLNSGGTVTSPTTTTPTTTAPTTTTTTTTTTTATTSTSTTVTTTTPTTTTPTFYVEPPEKKKSNFTFTYAGIGLCTLLLIVVAVILYRFRDDKNSKHTKRVQDKIKQKWEDQERELEEMGGVYSLDLGEFSIGRDKTHKG